MSLARDKAGRSIAARMAMMAITTSNSMRVKPARPPAVKRLLGNAGWLVVFIPVSFRLTLTPIKTRVTKLVKECAAKYLQPAPK